MTSTRKISYVAIVALVALLYFVIFLLNVNGVLGNYELGIMNFICINIILAVSLNITVGCLGQITLGHAGFMSIGAYAASLFVKSGILTGLPGYLVSLLVGGVIALGVGILIGIPGLRLKGDYLAIITLAFGEIIRTLIEYFDFTGGAQGLTGIPRYRDFTTIFVITVLSVMFMYSIMTSRHGRAVLAIREDEIASDAVGVNTTYYKVFAFALSAMFAGIAGGMYAQNMGNITARYFDYNNSINILVMVVLGGMGSFTGATISAIVLTILPEMLRTFADYRMIIYALVLIIMMIFRPTGLLGRKEFQITKIIDFIKIKIKGSDKAGGHLNE
ncbi:branched-chain amino acid ABC transporter permease [Miniphocaeibacter halophilus]|uniref:Branched-chain amino acid ABC transporter permease n=1 Tax=Miniphocaeibacter halophilus TaxID=2931922 RepID=A0AC61MRX4_9FIRM|nr:branched-chain amino acid ABC transporter permease [Miniphocaeibacter halophilus]QQK08349.1 branched-chain amino acid ABC transporter permease [Miniphocaeibacter halophilus]